MIFFIFFIERNNNSSFISFLKNKLIEIAIFSENLNEYLLFSSKKAKKEILLSFQLVINNCEAFNSICKKENTFISIDNYIEPNIKDDLMKLKDLVSIIVEKQKSVEYNSIKIGIKLFELYSNSEDYEHLKFVQSIINIIKKIDVMDEKSIGLMSKIHNIGINMIREEKWIMKNFFFFKRR